MKKKCNYLLFMSLIVSLAACSSNDGDIEDNENPVIACQDDITINIDAISSGAIVTYDTPVGTDNISVVTTMVEGLASGETFPVGTTVNTFRAQDTAGNTTSCSFNVIVTRDTPSGNTPYFIGDDPTPSDKKWTKVENLSDEFDGTTFDDSKWHRDTATDGFNWLGRPPGLFESDNVTVSDGNLNVTTEKFDTPKIVNNISWTHGGAIVRSKALAGPGQFYECKMKANKTVMSSTFWLSFKQNCNTGPVRKLELDIQECVGRVHSGTAAWAEDFANIYASNTWRHNRDCDTEFDKSRQKPAKTVLSEKNNERYFVYGCWWKSPTEILFYLDGELTHSIINPPAEFDLEGHITMAIETYDWNPIDDATIFETGSFDDLTTKYDWIRTWKLEDQ
ncbi:HYR domain-containing protein [Aquimarina sp. RZ0]|uniref:HYR domain-containing protein n=1 Tax=Aquimarina sp. RZ0 TaxID=2607730 RepID=UPI0011F3ECF8|nr:HYR domain-containing protein [Aquimarina sp. RZ0]KAA1243247.1 HYR domain-containing protein [Aquimarina sp. RZ0]